VFSNYQYQGGRNAYYQNYLSNVISPDIYMLELATNAHDLAIITLSNSINNNNNLDQYLYDYSLSLSSRIFNINVSTIDQYARNYQHGLSGVVRSY
jgi:hypothetical protein